MPTEMTTAGENRLLTCVCHLEVKFIKRGQPCKSLGTNSQYQAVRNSDTFKNENAQVMAVELLP